MILQVFPVEILVTIFAFVYGVNHSNVAVQTLYEALFFDSKKFYCKLDLVMKSLALKYKNMFNTNERGLLSISKYFETCSIQFYPDKGLQLGQYPRLKYLECTTINRWILPPELLSFQTLLDLQANTIINAKDLLKLPNLTRLSIDKIYSETYSEQFNLENLVLCPRLDTDEYRSGKFVALPYAQMFPKLYTLELICISSFCEAEIELHDLKFLRKFEIRSSRQIHVKFGSLPNLEYFRIADVLKVTFMENVDTFYPQLLTARLFRPANINFINFKASPHFKIENNATNMMPDDCLVLKN
jgi:hypothetical protein